MPLNPAFSRDSLGKRIKGFAGGLQLVATPIDEPRGSCMSGTLAAVLPNEDSPLLVRHKGSDLFVRALENEGVQYVFGVPGEENLDLLESLRTSSIRLVVTRHEQSAGFMAATYGRLTGKPGVCLSTLGPGATNLVTAAAYASLGGMPMLMITGQKPILQSRQARFQVIDTVAMMRPLTKMAKQIIDAGNIPTLVRDAFRVAQSERPGPVHLELPEDIAAQLTERFAVIPSTPMPRPVAPVSAIQRAVE